MNVFIVEDSEIVSDALQAMLSEIPALKVLMLTNYTDEIYVNRCMSAGADYFFDKTIEFIRVGTVLRQLMSTGGMGNRFVALQ